MSTKNCISDQKGSILIIALIMLALLTTLGIMSTNTTTIDLQIAQNERIYRENFNIAEAANMLAVQKIISEITTQAERVAATWIQDCESGGCTTDVSDPDNWFDATTGVPESEIEFMTVTINGQDYNVHYTAEYNGEFSGASQVLTNSDKLYKFTIYGLYRDDNRGEVMIKTALTKRFSS